MERRIGYWTTVSLIYQLSDISEGVLRLLVKFDPESPVESDPKLATHLQTKNG